MSAPAEFAAEFERLFAVAYRAGYAILGSREDAEDCAQESLAKLLNRWGRVPADRHVPWVARVATNAAIDRWRRFARQHGRAEPTAQPGVDAAQRTDLVRALRSLPRRQREAVVLRHILDLPERDVAAALGCSTGTVKSTTSRGLTQLRLALGTDWAEA